MFERRLNYYVDWALILALVALCAVGIAMIHSTTSSPTGAGSTMYTTQLTAIAIGVGAMVALAVIDYRSLADRSLLEIESRPLRVAIALLPTPFFVWWLTTWVKGVLKMDELQRRIELEALAFAFPTSLVFLAALGMLDSAVTLQTAEFSLRHVWLMMPMLYYVGLWNAQRRYS